MRTAPLLIALAVGYAVLVFARREARPLDLVGKIIGWLIIVVSFIGLLCIAASSACRMCPLYRRSCDTTTGCPFIHRGVSCVPLESMSKRDGDGADAAPAPQVEKNSPAPKK